MAKLLRSHGLALEGGVLTKPVGASDAWYTYALIDVPQPSNFAITVMILGDPSVHHMVYLIGIAHKDC